MKHTLPIILSISLLLSACNSNMDTSDDGITEYRNYLDNLKNHLDAEEIKGLEPGRRQALSQFAGEMLQLIEGKETFEDLTVEKRGRFELLTQKLYLVMIGKDGINCSDEEIPGDNGRSCSQLTQESFNDPELQLVGYERFNSFWIGQGFMSINNPR